MSGPRLPVILLLIGCVGCFLGVVYDAALTMAYYSNSEREFIQALRGAALCGLGGILTGVTAVRWAQRGKS